MSAVIGHQYAHQQPQQPDKFTELVNKDNGDKFTELDNNDNGDMLIPQVPRAAGRTAQMGGIALDVP